MSSLAEEYRLVMQRDAYGGLIFLFLFYYYDHLYDLSMDSCFPHIVNLACKAVLGVMTSMNYVQPGSLDYVPPDILNGILRDPIATLRSLIRLVRLFGQNLVP